MIKIVRKLRKENHGAMAIEYGLLVGFIAIASMVALAALGTSLINIYEILTDTFEEETQEGPSGAGS